MMEKKPKFSFMSHVVLLLSAVLLVLPGCGSQTGGTPTAQPIVDSTAPTAFAEEKKEDSIITIQMSDEAKKLEEKTRQDDIKALMTEEYFDQFLTRLSARSEQSFPECTLVNKLGCEECNGSEVYTLTHDNYENIILYTHGGGWINGIGSDHVGFCDALATRFNAKVYMPLYPLAPQVTSEESYAAVESLYKEILKEEKPIYISGDSAGGNITLGLMYTIKEEGLKKPEKMILLAPCVDMTMTNEAMQEIDKTDVILSLYGCRKAAEIWAGKENLKDPKNSALYADVTGYPDTMIIQGTNDILYPDTMIFYEKLKDAGVNVTLVIGEGLWHVFPVDPIPESEEVMNLIEKFCAE